MAGNTIDLSQVPAPDIVEALSYESILAGFTARMSELMPEFDVSDESDPAVKVMQIAAYRETLIRQRVNDAARATMLAYAQKGDLDNLGLLLATPRLDGENDDDYRERLTTAPDGFSIAGPSGAYVYHAKSASQDIADATAISPSPGDVLVTILSKAGDGTADEALIALVTAALTEDAVRPMTDNVTVEGAAIVEYVIDIDIYTYAGPDSSLVLGSAQTAVESYVASNRKLGRDITLNGLHAAVRVSGVQNAIINSPAADVVIDDTQAAYCTNITLNNAGTGE